MKNTIITLLTTVYVLLSWKLTTAAIVESYRGWLLTLLWCGATLATAVLLFMLAAVALLQITHNGPFSDEEKKGNFDEDNEP